MFEFLGMFIGKRARTHIGTLCTHTYVKSGKLTPRQRQSEKRNVRDYDLAYRFVCVMFGDGISVRKRKNKLQTIINVLHLN